MDISFDPAKNVRNIEAHGISLARAEEFEWDSAINREDTRKDYGERRFRAYGFIGLRLHAIVFTPREGRLHVISLRKANKREVRRYESETEAKKSSNGSRQSGVDR